MATYESLRLEYFASLIKQHPRRVRVRCGVCGLTHPAVASGAYVQGFEPIHGGELVKNWSHEKAEEVGDGRINPNRN